MARLYRPYIPLFVRVEVAARQCRERGFEAATGILTLPISDRYKLNELLLMLFANRPYALDHDPALVNRKKRRRLVYDKKTDGVKAVWDYSPRANDPNFLIYREAGPGSDHDIKTRVRGDGAQLSDLGKARKAKRVKKNRERGRGASPLRFGRKKAAKMGYNWPKGRKIRNRSKQWPS